VIYITDALIQHKSTKNS